MEKYYWKTFVAHANNTETMEDYLSGHLPAEFHIVKQDGSYAEIQSVDTAQIYAVHASGNGDFFNHVVIFGLIS